MNTPASRASAITDEQIQAEWDVACHNTPSRPAWNRHIRFARAVLALAAPTTQPTGQAVEPSQPAPVAQVESWTNGSYSRNYKMKWLRDVPEGTLLYASRTPAPAAPEDAKDAARWNMLPAFFEEYQIDAMKLYRDIDAAIASSTKASGGTTP